MRRLISYYLAQWRRQSGRKPLLLRGARQVGKTHAVRELGRSFTNYVEINFELTPKVKDVFIQDLQPQRILRELALITDSTIIPGETLLFLDEVQETPQAVTALRYFYEMIPELHVIAAGSLLDFAIDHISMPVGRLSSLYMHPMSFLEFLKAIDRDLLIEEILQHRPETALSDPIHHKLLTYLSTYLAVGGMPEAVQCWVETQDVRQCSRIHHELVDIYRQDFQKYSKKLQLKYIELLFDKIPLQLGKSIKFSHFSTDCRKRGLAPCLELLYKANLIYKVTHSAGNGMPLGAEVSPDKFKLIFLDVALSQAILGADLKNWILQPQQEFINKGEIVEAMIGQELLAYSSPHKQPHLYYWHREIPGSNAEIDYLVQQEEKIFPIEVKSGLSGGMKSMQLFLQIHAKSPYGIRFSPHNYSIFDHVHSYPLYAVAGLAEEKQALLSLLEKQ
jgi:hypothetical protein